MSIEGADRFCLSQTQERDRSVAWLVTQWNCVGEDVDFFPVHGATLGQSQVQEMKPVASQY